MAQILRLRGPDQIYGARGWSLFRLSHHRLVGKFPIYILTDQLILFSS